MTARGYQDTDMKHLTVSPATYRRRGCVMNISTAVSVCGGTSCFKFSRGDEYIPLLFCPSDKETDAVAFDRDRVYIAGSDTRVRTPADKLSHQ